MSKRITNPKEDIVIRCEIIDIAHSFIMFGMNQSMCRFTDVSPNMSMFGANLQEIPDIAYAINEMNNIINDPKLKLSMTEKELVNTLQATLITIRAIFKNDKENYIKIMKRHYDKGKIDIEFEKNEEGLHYVGDRKTTSYKLLNRWTGPWKVVAQVSPSHVRIYDENKGKFFKAKTDRIKRYNRRQYYNLPTYDKKVQSQEVSDIVTEEDRQNLLELLEQQAQT